jgi:hypothetical protein
MPASPVASPGFGFLRVGLLVWRDQISQTNFGAVSKIPELGKNVLTCTCKIKFKFKLHVPANSVSQQSVSSRSPLQTHLNTSDSLVHHGDFILKRFLLRAA